MMQGLVKMESDESRRAGLIKWVNSQSVTIAWVDEAHLAKMKTWCLENIGEERPWHPLGEAQEGWIDHFDGDWAFQYAENGSNFWFWKKRDLMAFQMVWK